MTVLYKTIEPTPILQPELIVIETFKDAIFIKMGLNNGFRIDTNIITNRN